MSDVWAEVTPLPGSAAGSVVWRQRGQLHVTVIVKATFAFAPDAEMPETEPQEILRGEVHHGKNPARSIRLSSDLSPYLARADVLFTGHAHAPREGPVRVQPVRLVVQRGDGVILDKALIARDQQGFQRLPLVYERAFTGLDMGENPFGVEADAASVVNPADPSRPAGYGPIARAWPARKRLLGTTPRQALDGPIVEIPEQFDWSYFQAAPPDQQVGFLHGDEWILMEGLHPVWPRIGTRLPGARGAARVHGLSAFGVREGQPIDLVADTLRIDGDEERCTVVWRRSFPVPNEAALAAARIVAGVERAGVPTAWPEPPSRRHEPAAPLPTSPGGPARTVVLDDVDPMDTAPTEKLRVRAITAPTERLRVRAPPGNVLPFVPAARGEAPALSGPRQPAASEPGPPTGTLVLGPDQDAGASSARALPFDHGAVTPAATLMLSTAEALPASAPLPFRGSSPVEPARAPSPAIAGAPWSAEQARPVPLPQSGLPTLALFDAETPVTMGDTPKPPEAPRPPPPAILSTPMRPVEPVKVPVVEAPPAAPTTDEGIGIEKVASISAELAERSAPRGEVLGAHGLSDARWTEAEKRWNEALAAEAKRGERALLEAHDDAFFKAWQAIRGPFGVGDYARLTLANERADLAAVLDTMGIRRTMWMRLKRIFGRRIAASAAFAAQVKQALADQRGRGGAPDRRR